MLTENPMRFETATEGHAAALKPEPSKPAQAATLEGQPSEERS